MRHPGLWVTFHWQTHAEYRALVTCSASHGSPRKNRARGQIPLVRSPRPTCVITTGSTWSRTHFVEGELCVKPCTRVLCFWERCWVWMYLSRNVETKRRGWIRKRKSGEFTEVVSESPISREECEGTQSYIKKDFSFFKKILTQGYVYRFLRERKGERGKKHWCERGIDSLPPWCAPTRDGTCNLGMCPDWESNLQTFGAWDDAPVNWATLPGAKVFLFFVFLKTCNPGMFDISISWSKQGCPTRGRQAACHLG